MLSSLLSEFDPVTLDEMGSVKLMNRVDTKYVTSVSRLEAFLTSAVAEGFKTLVTGDGERLCGYSTVYYDTEDLEMYSIHHSGRKPRRKVRVRTYGNSGQAFLEIKLKNNHGRTKKKRLPCNPENVFDDDCETLLKENTPYFPEALSPRLRTSFRRITLTDNALSERLTIDIDISFVNVRSSLKADLADAVIIELKQDKTALSRSKTLLRDSGIRPLRLSKYCVGTVLTNPGIKSNNFKEKLRATEKIINKKLI